LLSVIYTIDIGMRNKEREDKKEGTKWAYTH
jgi:hypothetical protein